MSVLKGITRATGSKAVGGHETGHNFEIPILGPGQQCIDALRFLDSSALHQMLIREVPLRVQSVLRSSPVGSNDHEVNLSTTRGLGKCSHGVSFEVSEGC